jgi:hypothetical protein
MASMPHNFVIPRAVKPLTREEYFARLAAQRAQTLKRIAAAHEHVLYWALRNPDESRVWRNHERSLRGDLEMIDDQLRGDCFPPDKERYASEQEAALRETNNCVGASNGAVDWENA